MRIVFLLAIVGLAGCGGSPSYQPVSPPPLLRPPLGPAPCARPVSGGFMDERLGTRCHFMLFRGVKVCVPDNMPIFLNGVCKPAGQEAVWLSREPNCMGDGTNPRYFLNTAVSDVETCTQAGMPGGNAYIGVIDPVPLKDQNIYFGDANGKNCVKSPISGNPLHPVHALAAPPTPSFIYEDNLPSVVCK